MFRRRTRLEPEAEVSAPYLSNGVLVVAVLAVALAAAALILMLPRTTAPTASASSPAWIGPGISTLIGTATAFALFLAIRRRRSARVAAAHAITEAVQRRVDEMVGLATGQLDSDTADVRLTGLYALERLAQTYPGQRQVVVNAVCAYLRTPCPSPVPTQEHQVRRTAQGILLRHLARDAPAQLRWEAIVDLSGAGLGAAGLYEADLRIAVLVGADLTGADLHDTDLRRADLRRADLTKADLTHVCLSAANLEQAGFTRADLAWADLSGTRLARANLTGANLHGTNLAHANLVEADLSAAHWTGDTVWPVGLQNEIRMHSTKVEAGAGEVLFRVWAGYRVP